MELFKISIQSFLTEKHNIDYEYYISVAKALNPKNDLLGIQMQALTEQPFKHIISIENLYKNIQNKPTNVIDIVSICFQIPTEEIEPIGFCEFYAAFNYVHESFTNLINRENKILHYEPENEEIEAGIESLSKFGRLTSIDALASGDLLKHNQIIDMPYSRVFTKMYMESEKAKFQKRLFAIKNRQQQ